MVYAVGGSANIHLRKTLKSVEKYDCGANQWEYVADMNIARYKHAACVLHEKLYVVGGYFTNGKIVKEIECYDPANDNWRIVGTVTDDLVCNALVAVQLN